MGKNEYYFSDIIAACGLKGGSYIQLNELHECQRSRSFLPCPG